MRKFFSFLFPSKDGNGKSFDPNSLNFSMEKFKEDWLNKNQPKEKNGTFLGVISNTILEQELLKACREAETLHRLFKYSLERQVSEKRRVEKILKQEELEKKTENSLFLKREKDDKKYSLTVNEYYIFNGDTVIEKTITHKRIVVGKEPYSYMKYGKKETITINTYGEIDPLTREINYKVIKPEEVPVGLAKIILDKLQNEK